MRMTRAATRCFALAVVSACSIAEASSTLFAGKPVGDGEVAPSMTSPGAAGDFQTSVPIKVPAFRGLEPVLTLDYDSNGGNGLLGVGWVLGGFSRIQRVGADGGVPNYDATDRYLLDGEPLVESTTLGGTHATKRQSFKRVRKLSVGWTVEHRDGRKVTYAPIITILRGVYRWGVESVEDPHGNRVAYSWSCDGTNDCYPSSVRYGLAQIDVLRELRSDQDDYVIDYAFVSNATYGKTSYRVSRINVLMAGAPVRSYVLSYKLSSNTCRSVLTQITQLGSDGVTALPPMVLTTSTIGTPTECEWTGNLCRGPQTVCATGLFKCPQGASVRAVTCDSRCGTCYSWNAFVCEAPCGDSFNVCGTGCPSGYHAEGLGTIAGCGGGGSTVPYNSAFCVKDTGDTFTKCGTGCPSGYHVTAAGSRAGCGGQISSWNSVTCQKTPPAAPFTKCGWNCPPTHHASALGYTGRCGGGGVPAWDSVTCSPNTTTPFLACGTRCPQGFHVTATGLPPGCSAGAGGPASYSAVRCEPDTGFSFQVCNGASCPAGYHPTAYSNTYGCSYGSLCELDTGDAFLKCNSSIACPPGYHFAAVGCNPACSVGGSTCSSPSSNSGRCERNRPSFTACGAYCPPGHRRTGGACSPQCGASCSGANASICEEEPKPVEPPVEEPAPWPAPTAPAGWQDILTAVDNGLGGRTALTYVVSNTLPDSPLPIVRLVLKSATVTDGRGGSMVTTFTYSGGRWDNTERRFLGFRQVNAVDATGAFTRTLYAQGAAYPLNTIESQYKKTAAGADLTYQTFTRVASAAAPFVLSHTDTWSYECNADSTCKRSHSQFTHDAYGNVVEQVDHGDKDVTGDERTTTSDYAVNTASPYLTSLLSQSVTRSGVGATGPVLAHVRYLYDGATSHNTPALKGDLTRVERWLDTAGRFVGATSTYDSLGNQTSSTDPLGRTTRYEYDPTHRHQLVRVTNPAAMAASVEWNFRCGQKALSRDANGHATRWSYDALCRVTQEDRPDGSYTLTSYVDFGQPTTQHVRTAVSDGSADGVLWSQRFFDGLGRTWRTRHEPDLTTDTAYDGRGLVSSVSAPYRTGEPPKLTTFTYDAAGRRLKVTLPDGKFRQYLYGDWSTTRCDELGKPTSEFRDGYGRTVRTREYLNKTCALAPACTLGTDCFDTRVGYDALGRRTSIVDAAGNQTLSTYDSLDRHTVRVDPDLGRWAFTYDDRGGLLSRTDARGQTLHFTYDALGRLTSKRLGASVLATYLYDEPGRGAGVGRLTSVVTDAANRTFYGYDPMGRRTSVTRLIAGRPYTVDTQYDAAGRLRALTDPDQEVVTYSYDASGRLGQMVSSLGDELVTHAEWDARGQLTGRVLGNGVEEAYTYDANRFLLTRFTTLQPGVR